MNLQGFRTNSVRHQASTDQITVSERQNIIESESQNRSKKSKGKHYDSFVNETWAGECLWKHRLQTDSNCDLKKYWKHCNTQKI